uniref:Repressor protein CI n=1 Tax=Myoviridae sp. ct7bD4 TaxID=2826618 RepID=A0A8S5NIA7_9CAUD|nr:MAG TPA: repressor protein CI [Myoviridae sp. ct7bD4]
MVRTERNFRLRQDVFYQLWNAKADEFKTQKSIQDAAELSKSTMRRLLLGNRVDYNTAQSIAKVFKVKIPILFGEVISYERL